MNMRNLFVIFGVIILAAAAVWYKDYRSMPANMPMGGDMSAAPIVNDINIPQLTAVQRVGERAFNENCAACHGENASGQEGVAPPLVHKIYEPSHHGDASFRLAAQNGVRAHHWPYGDMPPVPDITERDVNNIIAYVRALQRANGIF